MFRKRGQSIGEDSLWECGKRSFPSPLWESAFLADFHKGRHFHSDPWVRMRQWRTRTVSATNQPRPPQ